MRTMSLYGCWSDMWLTYSELIEKESNIIIHTISVYCLLKQVNYRSLSQKQRDLWFYLNSGFYTIATEESRWKVNPQAQNCEMQSPSRTQWVVSQQILTSAGFQEFYERNKSSRLQLGDSSAVSDSVNSGSHPHHRWITHKSDGAWGGGGGLFANVEPKRVLRLSP